MSAFDQIVALEQRRQDLYLIVSVDPYARVGPELREIAKKLDRLWHRCRCERRGCTDETPETLSNDRAGLISLDRKVYKRKLQAVLVDV